MNKINHSKIIMILVILVSTICGFYIEKYNWVVILPIALIIVILFFADIDMNVKDEDININL